MMENQRLVPENLVRRFMMGELSSSEEKALLDWIDQSPLHQEQFRAEQKRLSAFISASGDAQADKQWRRLSPKLQRTGRRKRPLLYLPVRFRIPAAAAALLVAMIGYFVAEEIREVASPVALLTESVSTHNGERTAFSLPDGTKVNLNADSRLDFPKEFNGDRRQVELSGEAFFEVQPGKVPFIVHTSDLDIRVLGTAFNVEAFPGTSAVNTTLVHGKVVLEHEQNHKKVKIAEMSPYDRVTFQKDNQQVLIQKQTNLEQYIGWKDGKLVFLNASIEELSKKLELWYNVAVRIEDEDLMKSHFTGTFTNESIEQVLRLLTISYPLEYRIEEVPGSPDPLSPKLKIILSSKPG